MNPTRQFEESKMVAPVGGFVNDETAFRYFETSKMAVFNGTAPLPTADCEQIGKSEWSCKEPQKSCSGLEFKTCKLITQYTDNGVFSMDLADASYIASTYTVQTHWLLEKSTFISGLQEEITHHVQRGMPRDEEQALQIPKREESLRNISTTDLLTAAINKLTDQVIAMDNRSSDQVIQSNGPQNNWNQRFNGGPGNNRGQGHFRGNHHNRGNFNYRGNIHRGNHQDHVNSQY
ncbi:unnamed protein product [Caenorhabditis nigoni]